MNSGSRRADAKSMEPIPVPDWLHRALGAVAGRGVRVGIVDSGLDGGPLVFRPNLGPGLDLVGDEPGSCGTPVDLLGHGTACLSTVYRLAPAAIFSTVRVFLNRPKTSVGTLCAAVAWATDQRLDVLNLSLRTGLDADSARLFELCERARQRGMTIVCASPPDGAPALPGWFDCAISVGPGPFRDPYTFSYHADQRVEVRAAPGVNGEVLWRDGVFVPAVKASYATPVIAGIVALMRERYPRAELEDVRDLLAEFSQDRRGRTRAGLAT